MEDNLAQPVVDGTITSIHFSLATHDEICTSSISDCPISHPSQLTNPFLGLPLETGKCESCGTAEPGKCDGHFGYIQLPVPVYHPCHVSELKRLLDLVCLKCLRMKKNKARLSGGNDKSSNAPCSYCPDIPQLSIFEAKTSDGAVFLELKPDSKFNLWDGFWNFLDRYGYRYSEERERPLLPSEVQEILKRFPEDTRKKLAGKGYFPQDGYILQELPVPPNCLSVPDISDGISIMSSDLSVSMLKKLLRQSDIIKGSRSGPPNFESNHVEANDLQLAIAQYLNVRGTAKASQGINVRFGISKVTANSATKAWLEKMRTLFISKGSGFSSRTVITGDAYRKVNEVGLPLEIAEMITFEEKVTEHNRDLLQKLVDNQLCLTYKDVGSGGRSYSLTAGSKGHTILSVGQVVHRRVMDGDTVFINRQPSTHKHSLQALSVYVHDDHTVKINPLICAPLAADFDGDCIHMFYPQSLAAKAEVLELFSVEQQLLSSHSGILNLQLANDSLLSLKILFKKFILDQQTAQQLSMFLSNSLPHPFLSKANSSGPQWTVLQILQTALPAQFDCLGEKYLISQSEILKADCDRDMILSFMNEIISSVCFVKGPKGALNVFNSLQPLLMEHLFLEGYSVSLEELYVPKSVSQVLQQNIRKVSPLLRQLRQTYNELVEMQIENYLRTEKVPLVNFIRECSSLGNLIDLRSDSSIDKVVQQIGFLGIQLADRGKFYSRILFEDTSSFLLRKYAVDGDGYPSEAFGLIKSCFIQGLNPYEELVHSTSSREVLVRSSRGLTEPGTLFKNLMAILRDVIISYDGTVRNVCTNSVVQFEYGMEAGTSVQNFYPAGEPVGVLAATAVSNNAYKAVLDSSSSSNSSWNLMKEVLLCGVNFKNEINDRRVILYLNDCSCGKKYCKENAAYLVKNQLKRVSLKEIAVNFLIEYQKEQTPASSVSNANLVGHIHLDKKRLKAMNRSMHEVLFKCQETIGSLRRKKKSNLGEHLKRIFLSVSDCCRFQQCDSEWSQSPCLRLSSIDTSAEFEKTSQFMANIICPILLETVIKGDRRVDTANIIWISPLMPSWVRNYRGTDNGELALEIVLQKGVVKQTGDAWRIVLDSCLPVINSIDTSRSIPYAVKQVQELLGISCAFDQAVQRLTKSISKVSKGVLKEHLTLVANSMTCTGSLIGFNRVGYKALFRSLNVQVPFAEATLFMPRQCFERAAEKCHQDSLSSIVASCSWGKQVTVGTGTRFEILWNKKEMGLNKDGVIDVYNFLQLVRDSTARERLDTACLGEEIDDLDLENADMELPFSPEHNSDYGKLIFDDDDTEFQCKFEQLQTEDKEKSSESNWQKDSSKVESGGSGGWEVGKNSEQPVTGKSSSWGGWGTDMKDSPSTKPSEELQGAAWDAKDYHKKPSNSWDKPDQESNTSCWERGDGNSQWDNSNRDNTAFKKPSSIVESGGPGGWEVGKISEQPVTGKSSSWGGWGNDPKVSQSTKPSEELQRADWDTRESYKQPSNSWAKPDEESDSRADGNSQWGNLNRDNTTSKKPSSIVEFGGPGGWEVGKNSEQPVTGKSSSWGGWGNDTKAIQSTKPSEELQGAAWDTRESHKQPSNSWAQPDEEFDSRADGNSQWGNLNRDNTASKKPSSIVESGRPGSWKLGKISAKPVTGKSSSWDGLGTDMKDIHSTKPSEELQGAVWDVNESHKQPSSSWGKPNEESDSRADRNSQWGNLNSDTASKKPSSIVESSGPGGWEVGKHSEQPVTGKSSSWGGWGTDTKDSQSTEPSEEPQGAAWDAKESHKQTSNPWDKESDSNSWARADRNSQWGNLNMDNTLSKKPSTWDTNEMNEQATKPGSSNGWGSPYGVNRNEQGNRQSSIRAWGSSNAGDGRFKKNWPARSPGKPEDWDPSGVFSAPKNKGRFNENTFNEYTEEEKTIFHEVEPIVLSMRRILQQTRNDERLSDDDQTYVLEKVFNYHPDKETKSGSGIDYVTVSDSRFQGSRCFYIVSTDGRKEDFSYPKCIMNFVEQKYSEIGVSFNGKYFSRKRQQRSVGRQEQGQMGEPRFRGPQGQGWSEGLPSGLSQETGWVEDRSSQEHQASQEHRDSSAPEW